MTHEEMFTAMTDMAKAMLDAICSHGVDAGLGGSKVAITGVVAQCAYMAAHAVSANLKHSLQDGGATEEDFARMDAFIEKHLVHPDVASVASKH
mgnify:CR=1 FL=1